jgi:hypothetical protein
MYGIYILLASTGECSGYYGEQSPLQTCGGDGCELLHILYSVQSTECRLWYIYLSWYGVHQLTRRVLPGLLAGWLAGWPIEDIDILIFAF